MAVKHFVGGNTIGQCNDLMSQTNTKQRKVLLNDLLGYLLSTVKWVRITGAI